jgi:hypothetical protein
MKRPSRTPSILSASLHRSLNAYGLAASAAGMGVQVLAQPVEAKVVYTPAHVVIPGDSGYYFLDLNHDGVPDLRFANWLACTETCWNSLYVFAPIADSPIKGKNAVVGARTHTYTFAYALDKGAIIGGKEPFKWFADLVRVGMGPWYDVTDRYLGIKFQIKGKTHYGWARLSVTGTFDTTIATITGYAYETIPNKSIIAGETKGPDHTSIEGRDPAALSAPTRESAALGALAMGAPGLSIRRREEKPGTAQ